MKLTKEALKRIIKEEFENLMEENSDDFTKALMNWATHRRKAEPNEQAGEYDVNGGKAVFVNEDGYVYYGAANANWNYLKKLRGPLTMEISMINVYPPSNAESLGQKMRPSDYYQVK